MKKIILSAVLLTTAFISGCAHQIQLNPNTSQFVESKNKIDVTVGYHISEADRVKK